MKLLFVAENMNINGANKSLLNLLSAINTDKHQVDLFLFGHHGPFMSAIPSGVTVLAEDATLKYFGVDLKTALKNAPLKIKLVRVCAAVFKKMFRKGHIPVKETLFRWVPPLNTAYDLAVGYCEGSSHRFVLEKVTAAKKAGWIHIRLEDMPFDQKRQVSFCRRLDHTVVVSQDSKASAVRCGVPEGTVTVIHNLLPIEKIFRFSTEGAAPFEKTAAVQLLTVGRLVWQKGIDLILETAVLLKDRNVDFCWSIIGGGTQMLHYREKAEALGVSDRVSFLGSVDNPYVAMAGCDVYVQPSISEGWGMAITEAKILNKPVIVSDIPVFREQVTHEVNGLISPLLPKDIADSIVRMITDHALRESIVQHISQEEPGYEKEVNILYELCR